LSKTAAEIKEQKWVEDIAGAKHRVLLLDYDGTIAPFARDRHRAFPHAEVSELLHSVMTTCNTRLIVISGRAAHEVSPLLGLAPAPEVWGAHGIERIHADGRYEEGYISQGALHRLAEAEALLEGHGLSDFLEIKIAGVGVHWRGLTASSALRIRMMAHRILKPLTSHSDLVLSEFEEGVEIRLRSANKGNAIRRLLAEIDPGTYTVYLGDDTTDEDVFRELQGRDLTVLVRPTSIDGGPESLAAISGSLLNFLKVWIASCGGRP
jgi:trehalose 6-phosphate phosphatase